jgi:hypothetical protein
MMKTLQKNYEILYHHVVRKEPDGTDNSATLTRKEECCYERVIMLWLSTVIRRHWSQLLRMLYYHESDKEWLDKQMRKKREGNRAGECLKKGKRLLDYIRRILEIR